MAFPDRIERTVEIARPPAEAWAALTTAEGLSSWFGTAAEIDLRPGGLARVTGDSCRTYELRVERVDEPRLFAYTWPMHGLPDGDPRRTYVEFTLEPTGTGTRVTVVESGFAQLAEDTHRTDYDGHNRGWASKLGQLTEYLVAAA
jgi:uncharacterized protein YndB with AHSA1/START domain